MEYGYVCFAYSKDEWIARAIAWFTKSQWSHSFITVPPMLGEDMVMEASSNGISMVQFDVAYRENKNQKYEIYKFKIPQEQIDRAIWMTMFMLETSYGFLEYPWFIWRAVNSWFGRDIKHQDNWSQQGTVCSGLVRLYLEYAGFESLVSGFGKDSANAQDMYNIIKANPDLFELVESKS